MTKERVDVLAFKQGLFETREQAKRGVMAGLVVSVINGQRFDKPGEKIDDTTELKFHANQDFDYKFQLNSTTLPDWSLLADDLPCLLYTSSSFKKSLFKS